MQAWECSFMCHTQNARIRLWRGLYHASSNGYWSNLQCDVGIVLVHRPHGKMDELPPKSLVLISCLEQMH